MQTRRKRVKRYNLEQQYVVESDDASMSPHHRDPDDDDALRKSRIRDSNKEFARRMTILQSWSEYWTEYTLREGEPYSTKQQAKDIIAKSKRISCPIESCGKTFTTPGGLRYHYARCNIERSFKCIVCKPPLGLSTRGEILRHMIQNHYNELPELNKEQKEIANSYLSCERKNDKTKKDNKLSSNEVTINAQTLVKTFYDLQRRIFHSENFTNRPFKEWQSYSKDWQPVIYEIDRRRYYPPELESVRFKLSTKNDWNVIKAGESFTLQEDKKNLFASELFHTGGINTATSWLPKPPHDAHSTMTPDLIAISVNCCSMDTSFSFGDSHHGEGCIQFWNVGMINDRLKPTLSYMVGHNYGTIFEMTWCPLGASWQPPVNTGDLLSRVGLLAVACGDGQLRILSVPHTSSLLAKANRRISDSALESTPIFRVKPTACLMAPGVGPSTNYQTPACKTICWNLEDNQRLIAAGYSNGNVALFDLANNSPILYTNNEYHHIYQPLKSWVAHGAPVTSISILSDSIERTVIATGSTDRQLKICNPLDLSSCLTSDRAPITKISWDYRYRGIVIATDSAFTNFHNRVTYRYPAIDGTHSMTISSHRSTVWGLDNSNITSSIATSDGSGEVFVMPRLAYKTTHRREKSVLSSHSLYTMVPKAIEHIANGLVNTNITDNDSKPTKFLLPIEHRPIEDFSDFKNSFGVEFINYDETTPHGAKLPESCTRASDIKNIYCDRPCDYPFSSINCVSWSPNIATFSYLLSATQIGLCRLDKVKVVEQTYRGYVDTMRL